MNRRLSWLLGAPALLSAFQRLDLTTGAWLGAFVAAGSGGLTDPDGMAFGHDGNLYVSSLFTHQVLRYDGRTGAFLGPLVTGSPCSSPPTSPSPRTPPARRTPRTCAWEAAGF